MSIFASACTKQICPLTPGNEAAGTVEAIGPGVDSVKPGDRVAYAMTRGSYAEYTSVPATQLVKLPDGVDFPTAAAAMLQGMTAHYLTHSGFCAEKRRYLPDSRGTAWRRRCARQFRWRRCWAPP